MAHPWNESRQSRHWRSRWFGFAFAGMAAWLGPANSVLADQYEVTPRGTPVRGHFWLEDGPAYVGSSNQSAGNRFQLGAELQLLEDYRLILGWTLLDILSSGESDPSVGGIRRIASDLDLGYFLIPDRLWVRYSFQLGEVRGNNIIGYVNTYGHGLSLGGRIFEQEKFNIGLELSYLYIGAETTPTFNFFTGATGSATYPKANVVSLALRLGFDVGGK